MESKSKIGQFFSQLSDKINEQSWFQELKGKWEELDPQSRMYLKFAGVGTGALLFVILTLSSLWSVHTLKKDLAERSELLSMIQSANDELHRLREAGPGASGTGEDAPWPGFFENVSVQAGMDKTVVEVSAEKPAPAPVAREKDKDRDKDKEKDKSEPPTKESLFDINLKHVSIKQVVRYAYYVENGSRPVKLRNISIDTKSDPEGYMNATLSVSGFTLKQ